MGIFLGLLDRSSEVLIGFEKRVVRARSFKRRPPSERADGEMLLSIRGVPWAPTPDTPDSVKRLAVIDRAPEEATPGLPAALPELPPPEARNVYIRKTVELAKYGYTDGCPGCKAARANQPPKAHSAACRARIEHWMVNDPALARACSRLVSSGRESKIPLRSHLLRHTKACS